MRPSPPFAPLPQTADPPRVGEPPPTTASATAGPARSISTSTSCPGPRRRASRPPCRAARTSRVATTRSPRRARASTSSRGRSRRRRPVAPRLRPAREAHAGFGQPTISISRHVKCDAEAERLADPPPCPRSGPRSAAPGSARVAVRALGFGEAPLAEARDAPGAAGSARSRSGRRRSSRRRFSSQSGRSAIDSSTVGRAPRLRSTVVRAELARADEHAVHAEPVRARTSASTSSPTIHVSRASASSASSAASK